MKTLTSFLACLLSLAMGVPSSHRLDQDVTRRVYVPRPGDEDIFLDEVDYLIVSERSVQLVDTLLEKHSPEVRNTLRRKVLFIPESDSSNPERWLHEHGFLLKTPSTLNDKAELIFWMLQGTHWWGAEVLAALHSLAGQDPDIRAKADQPEFDPFGVVRYEEQRHERQQGIPAQPSNDGILKTAA